MIESIDLVAIDSHYFEIIGTSDYYVTLRSMNTRHEWHLLERIANGHRIFVISHRHRPSEPYHMQLTMPSVEACCTYIKDHDGYHLEKIRKKKERRLRRLGLIVPGESQQKKLPATD